MAPQRPQPTRIQRRKQVDPLMGLQHARLFQNNEAHRLEASPVEEPARDHQDIDSDVESVLADWDPVGFDAQDFDDIMSVPEQAESAEPMDVDDQGNDIVKVKVCCTNH